MSRNKRLSPRKRPRQARARATVENVLTAAAQVFEGSGYAAGSTNHIAERAGVSIGTLYQYFPNKESILVQLAQRHIEESMAAFARVMGDAFEAPDVGIEELVRRFVDAMLETHRGRPRLTRALLEEAPQPPELRALLQQRHDSAIAAVESLLQSRRDVGIKDARLAAGLAVDTVQAVTHQWVQEQLDDSTVAQLATELVTMLTTYLRRD